MTRTCPSCGTPAARESAKHCHECGTPLGAPSGEPDTSPAERDTGGVERRDTPGGGPPPPPPGGPQQGTQRYGGGQHPSGLSSETRNWAMGAHLSAFLGAWVALAFAGPLVVWVLKRDGHPFVERHAREALNFNLNLLLWLVVGFVLAIATIGLALLVVVPVAVAIAIAWLVLTVIAAVRAANGEDYRYPLTIRFVS